MKQTEEQISLEALRMESVTLQNKLTIEEGKLSSLRTGRDIKGKITEAKKEAYRIELGRKTKKITELQNESKKAGKDYLLAALNAKGYDDETDRKAKMA